MLESVSITAVALLARCFDSVSAFDHICLEGDGSWPAVEFQEETSRVAEH